MDLARADGIEPPSAYAEGFPHANCLNQGCVRGGQAYWHKLLRERPKVYAATEQAEQGIRATDWGKDATMLKRQRNGTSVPITLRDFRRELELQPSMFDADEWGGCGCFIDGP